MDEDEDFEIDPQLQKLAPKEFRTGKFTTKADFVSIFEKTKRKNSVRARHAWTMMLMRKCVEGGIGRVCTTFEEGQDRTHASL